jgi:hypothetical protein
MNHGDQTTRQLAPPGRNEKCDGTHIAGLALLVTMNADAGRCRALPMAVRSRFEKGSGIVVKSLLDQLFFGAIPVI